MRAEQALQYFGRHISWVNTSEADLIASFHIVWMKTSGPTWLKQWMPRRLSNSCDRTGAARTVRWAVSGEPRTVRQRYGQPHAVCFSAITDLKQRARLQTHRIAVFKSRARDHVRQRYGERRAVYLSAIMESQQRAMCANDTAWRTPYSLSLRHHGTGTAELEQPRTPEQQNLGAQRASSQIQ